MRTVGACLLWPGGSAISSCHSQQEETSAPTLPDTASTVTPCTDGVTIPLHPPSHTCFPRTHPRITPAPAKPSLASAQPKPTGASTSMEQRNLMTLQTENSICLIPCCFPAFKPCIGAQQPHAPGTEPGSVPWQSPDAWVTGSSLPAAATAHSSSQPGAALGIPRGQSSHHCVPGPCCRGKREAPRVLC